MMGVRLVPGIESAVLYYRRFLVVHVRMTHACPDYLRIWLQSFEALSAVMVTACGFRKEPWSAT